MTQDIVSLSTSSNGTFRANSKQRPNPRSHLRESGSQLHRPPRYYVYILPNSSWEDRSSVAFQPIRDDKFVFGSRFRHRATFLSRVYRENVSAALSKYVVETRSDHVALRSRELLCRRFEFS